MESNAPAQGRPSNVRKLKRLSVGLKALLIACFSDLGFLNVVLKTYLTRAHYAHVVMTMRKITGFQVS